MVLPDWLQIIPDGPEKQVKINRFYIRLASLYASEGGTVADLAFLIGINYNTLKSQTQIVPASQKTRDGIHRLLGPAFVPPKQ